MYCPNCGTQIEDHLAICPHCGALTGEETATEVAKKEKKPLAPRAMSIAGFIVSLIAVVSNISILLSYIESVVNDRVNSYFSSEIFLLATVGLVIALVGWFTGKHIEKDEKYKNTYALAGIILGIIGLCLGLVYCCFYFIRIA